MNLSFETYFAIGTLVLFIFGVAAIVFVKAPKRLHTKYFEEQWLEIQSLCSAEATWPLAVMNADKLVDTALNKRSFKGKTMGERLVSAQRCFTNNDAVWYAHKLRNKIAHETNLKLRQGDVKQALIGFRQALKDLGAL